MFKFDLQRFADDAEPTPETTEAQPVAPTTSEAGSDANESGNLGTQPQTPPTFTQDQVNQIVEQRLARERRAWERRLQEVQEQFQQQVVRQATPPINPQELNKQFLAEFSRDPLGTLRKFAQTLTAEQARQVQTVVQRTQTAAREALDRMQERYPDWQQQSGAVMQYIQTNPALNSILQQKGVELTPEMYEGILEAAYAAVRARQAQTQPATTMPTMGDAQAKMRAAAPVQKAVRSQPTKSAEDVLFEEMMSFKSPF